jgi:hypothetical protein
MVTWITRTIRLILFQSDEAIELVPANGYRLSEPEPVSSNGST